MDMDIIRHAEGTVEASPSSLTRFFRMPLAIRSEPMGAKGVRVVLEGSLDRRNVARFKRAIREAWDRLGEGGGERPALLLDLKALRTLDGSGLSALVALSAEGRKRGVALQVTGTTPTARRLIGRSGLHQMLEIEEN